MKLAPLPETINPWRLAKSGAEIKGSISVSSLPRLAELVVDDKSVDEDLSLGVVSIRLTARQDEQYRVYLEGKLQATPLVLCQLCLSPMRVEIAEQFSWLVVKTDEQAENALADHDPVFANEDRVNLLRLIEDEMILELPLAPSHELKEGCLTHESFEPAVAEREFDSTEQTKQPVLETTRPFADLKTLIAENKKHQ